MEYKGKSKKLYLEWRKYHAAYQWVMGEIIEDLSKEANKSKRPLSMTKIIEKMKDKPRVKKRINGQIVLSPKNGTVRRVRLQMNRNHYPFYAAFYKVIMAQKRPDIVKRLQTYKSKHDPEGQIRQWLESEGVIAPQPKVVQSALGMIDEAPVSERTDDIDGHY